MLHFLLQVAPPPITTPNNLIADFRNAAKTWEPMMRHAGMFIMGSLLLWDFAWSARKKAGEGADYQEIANFLTGRIIIWGVFWGFLTMDWPQIIIDGFVQLGKQAGHLPATTTASSLFAAGADICGALWKAGTPLGLTLGAITSLPYIAAGVLIFFAFAWLAIHYVKFTLEAVVSISAGMIFLGFAPLPATRQYAERYITMVLAAGFRLQCFFLLLSVSMRLADYWKQKATQAPMTTDAILGSFVIAGEAALYGFLCYGIPVWVSAMIQGSVQFTGQQLTGFLMPYIQASTVAGGMAVTGAMGGIGAAAASAPGMLGAVARTVMGGSSGGNNGKSPGQPSPSAAVNSGIGRVPRQPRP